jgi:Alanyl-tRNA synthetase
MSLTREELKNLGLEGDAIETVMTELGKEKTAAQDLQHKLDDANSDKETLATQVKERDDKIASLGETAGASEKLKEQVSQLQNSIKEKDDAHASELAKNKLDSAVKLALVEANVHDPNDVISQIDLETVKLEDGKVKGLDEQIRALRKASLICSKEEAEQPPKPGIKAFKKGNASGGGAEVKSLNDLTWKNKTNCTKKILTNGIRWQDNN